MSNIVVSEEEILKAEESRVTLRNNLRAQGIACSDDETIDSLASKVANIQGFDKYINKTLSGVIYDENLTSLGNDFFRNQPNITEITILNATTVGTYCFSGCSSLKKLSLPKVSSMSSNQGGSQALEELYIPNCITIGNQGFRGNSSLRKVYAPKLQDYGSNGFFECALAEVIFPRLTKNVSNSDITTSTSLEIVDYGSTPSNAGTTTFQNKNNLKYLIQRKNDAITTLSATSVFNGTPFNTSGGNGKSYVPNSLVSTYENASNWSALAGTTFIALEGSRFEDLDWYDDYNSTCTLDGGVVKVLDNETVAIFKHTENIEHLYENGVEVTDTTELVKGRTFTSTI